MHRLSMTLKVTTISMVLCALTSAASADLTPAEIEQIRGKSGIQVFTSDGGFIGRTNGIAIRGDRVRLFTVPKSGSVLRRGNRNVNITTVTQGLILDQGRLVVDADTRELRTLSKFSGGAGAQPVEVSLLGKRR